MSSLSETKARFMRTHAAVIKKHGIAVGIGQRDGTGALAVRVPTPEVAALLPERFEGVVLAIDITGRTKAL